MKTILSLSLIAGFLVLSCTKEKENQMNSTTDTLTTSDSMMTTPPVTADTMTTAIPPRDSIGTTNGNGTMPPAGQKDSMRNK